MKSARLLAGRYYLHLTDLYTHAGKRGRLRRPTSLDLVAPADVRIDEGHSAVGEDGGRKLAIPALCFGQLN